LSFEPVGFPSDRLFLLAPRSAKGAKPSGLANRFYRHAR
jgi:hypothetical protein